MGLTIDRMAESDMGRILDIQSENQRENLTPSQQKDGYLSIAFSAEELRAFDNNLCVAVAREQDEVVGYCCISSAQFNSQFPILDQIVADLSSYCIPGTQDAPLREKTCIYGPVCISGSHRGKAVLERLSSFGLGIARDRGYLYCLSFISSENRRSLRAHTKLYFHPVGRVSHKNNEYIVIARRL